MWKRIGLWLLVMVAVGTVRAGENKVIFVPSQSGTAQYFSSEERYPTWYLNVFAETDYEHVSGTQKPDSGPWVMTYATPGLCQWSCFVHRNESELFFQQVFSGDLKFTGERPPLKGSGKPDDTSHWAVEGERTEYKVLPQQQTIFVGETATFKAIADFSENYDYERNPVLSN